MSVQVRRRREAAAFLATFVGAQGELIVDTTNNRVQVHDGATAGGFSAAKLSEVVTNTRTAVADANYSALATDRLIAFTALTAARTLTLPAASAYPTGTQLFVIDESGACSATNTITLARAGSDLINGNASVTVAGAYGFLAVESNGVSRWTIIDQTVSGGASTAAITGGTIDGTAIGGTAPATAKFTTLSVSTSVSLPGNSVTSAYLAQMPTLTLKANVTGATATPTDSTLSALLDASQGSTRGSILYRGVGGWAALAPGVTGTVLTANGTGVDPSYQAAGGATALSVPVRQTVMSGPVAAGVPAFLPATSSSLTLTAQNVTASAPLIVTAAQGFGASGGVNAVSQFTSNPSWTATTSATNYHYVNAQTGATGTTTLQPIYQFGGTVAVTSGQFTFDYQAMIGYLGNGSAAVATPFVFVGESVAGAGTITSTAAYAYNGYCDIGFVSGLPPAGGGFTNKTTNLGVLADRAHLVVENITAEQNYNVGDRLSGGFIGWSASGGVPGLLGPVVNRNTVALIQPDTSYVIVTKTTGKTAGATPANWKWKIIVSVPWRTQ